ncbi:hypothetical protein IFM89_007860 [Coptis chinensis]|uniref:Fe2OG dioxygenase domain-containing protein n=1 Tax=Coptis chinensis TaxID=261450 RepID=A0A835GWL4_9MAGN|nr:hypothetical protein IFM89_007860 [Coptis chinensis]
MGSISSDKIPAIVFYRKDLRPGTPSWCAVRDEIRQALELYGCFEAAFGGTQLHPEMLGELEKLFGLSSETKNKYTLNDVFEGYNGSYSNMPLLESISFDDVPVIERLQSFTDLMWPEGNSNFCDILCSYVRQVSELELMVKRMIFESFGLERDFNATEKSTSYHLRAMRYMAPKTNEPNLGIDTHTDASFLTILNQNQVHGLEVQTKKGEWISVKPAPSSYVVMIGDACMAWSNCRLHNPIHRVMMRGDAIRYSIGLLSYAKGITQTPEELVDEEHPLLFKPFNHLGYHQFIVGEDRKGLKHASAMKAYCGV